MRVNISRYRAAAALRPAQGAIGVGLIGAGSLLAWGLGTALIVVGSFVLLGAAVDTFGGA